MAFSVRSFCIVQQLEYMDLSLEEIIRVLESKNAVQDYALIIHDKDKNEDGDLVAPHYHIAVRLNDSRKSNQIAKWFKVEEQYLEKIKGQWKDILAYLTHRNAPDKYQYPVEEVICNFDYETGLISNGGRKEEIINKIANGEIREYNIHKEISVLEYDKYKRNIDNAFAFRQKILLERIDREMECIFITGCSGSGKTTQAKRMCEKKGYSYFVSSSSNDPFDGYRGQDAIILDDLRGSVFSFADLLKITDNHTSSMVKSRYRNKVLECKLLIITSIMPISQFYSTVFENSEEPLLQFERRMQTYVIMTEDTMKIHYFDKFEQSYIKVVEVPNPVAKLYENKSNDIERMDFINDIFGDDLL